jgi:glycosyltransferase involved in cell wall biosynthesis
MSEGTEIEDSPAVMTVLYICYQSVREPLTQTQVIAYLKGLRKPERHIVLLTFEPAVIPPETQAHIRDELAESGMEWHSLRYHKWPTLPATAFDIAAGIHYGVCLNRARKIRVIHARSHVPGVIALVLKALTGARMLLDFRGLMAEEYVDAQVWHANGLLFGLTKSTEKRLMSAADSVVVLTEKARQLLKSWYPSQLSSKPVSVIPCCVPVCDREILAPEPSDPGVVLGYCGKLGGLYATPEMLRFVKIAGQVIPGLRFHIWTQSDTRFATKAMTDEGVDTITTIGRLPPAQVIPHLRQICHAALSFITPCFSKQASSPTKIAEYLAAGLPLIVTTGIGDVDQIVRDEQIGIVLPEFSDSAYREAAQALLRLLGDESVRARCIRVARKYFDMERIGWERYRAVYDQLAKA